MVKNCGCAREPSGASNFRLVTAPNLPTQLTPGDAFSVTLFLDSTAPITQDLNVVVRLVNAQGETVFQEDGWPWGRPTSTWRPQEVWYDGHVVRTPVDAAAGSSIGWRWTSMTHKAQRACR